jgi:hypothetical protein
MEEALMGEILTTAMRQLEERRSSPRLEFLDAFFQGYLHCAFWSSPGHTKENFEDEAEVEAIAPLAREEQYGVCRDFVQANLEDLVEYVKQRRAEQGDTRALWSGAGHDFWLTRSGHGAGFWDRGLGELGARLTRAAKVYGGCTPYLGDDKKVYFTPA